MKKMTHRELLTKKAYWLINNNTYVAYVQYAGRIRALLPEKDSTIKC